MIFILNIIYLHSNTGCIFSGNVQGIYTPQQKLRNLAR